VPVLDLAGRGLNLSLKLFCNSQLWTTLREQDEDGISFMHHIFDRDNGWPEPG
jgi:hypothetical protein